MRPANDKILTILGPTASGKSDLAVKTAKWLESESARRRFGIKGAEIISADSRQVYKGLDLGTCKITKREMRGIPHHLLSVTDPKRQFSVTRYQKLGRKAVGQIFRRNKIPIVAGGTGLYIDALLYGYKFPEVKPDSNLRNKLEKMATQELHAKLIKLDRARAKNIDRHNRRRLIRALEIAISTGKPSPLYGEVAKRKPKYRILKIGLNPPPEVLKKRIHLRLIYRLRKGMVTEVKKLKKSGLSSRRLGELGLEYRAINRFLEGKIGRETALRQIEIDSWHYAKRQMTWWKRDGEITWIKNKNIYKKSVSEFLQSS